MEKKRSVGVIALGIASLLSGLRLFLEDADLLWIITHHTLNEPWFRAPSSLTGLLSIGIIIGLFIAWIGVFCKKRGFLKPLIVISVIEVIHSIFATIGLYLEWTGEIRPMPHIFRVSLPLGVFMAITFISTIFFFTRPKVKRQFIGAES